MAKISIRLPEPKEEYDVSNQKQINRALTIMNADTITLTLTDASSNVFSLYKTKAVSANETIELLSQPIILQESEVIKATAATGNRLHILLSVLQINRE